ncbi:MAG: 30S ribosomal protein S8 [Alphaproteobacteria bacterium]|jgi:small subunit ribosomal protein S8|nr:30S ribosomal protein S8 [Alphaproteobacteria bacterium]MBP9049624.1 30S ribosomal protein S8 [Alphaproteobacteria bacterium]MBP9867382.1 30S ribosomal protein S8 [Alphaproteobacteria bacterium]
MSMCDPLGDMLTRIRNGQMAGLKVVGCPASQLRANVLKVLKECGYIRDFKESLAASGHKELSIELKYDSGQPVIKNLSRVSKPGRRVYAGASNMPRYYNGLGVVIVSTPKGVLSDQQARDENVGGEVLCQVF